MLSIGELGGGGTEKASVYVDGKLKGYSLVMKDLIAYVPEGNHVVSACIPYDANEYYTVCGEDKIYVADDTATEIEIELSNIMLTPKG